MIYAILHTIYDVSSIISLSKALTRLVGAAHTLPSPPLAGGGLAEAIAKRDQEGGLALLDVPSPAPHFSGWSRSAVRTIGSHRHRAWYVTCRMQNVARISAEGAQSVDCTARYRKRKRDQRTTLGLQRRGVRRRCTRVSRRSHCRIRSEETNWIVWTHAAF